jgi:hypothetical protein
MPPEWRLTYYNTQFNCVFLEDAQWRAVPREESETWAEDVNPGFLFLLEGGPEDTPPAALQAQALCLSNRDERLIWFDGQTDIRSLSDTLKARSGETCYLISRDGDLAQLERVRTLLNLLGLLV